MRTAFCYMWILLHGYLSVCALSLSLPSSLLLSSCPTSTNTNTHWAHNYTPAIWHVFLFLPEKTNKFYLFVLNQYMAKTHYLCSAEFCVLIHPHPKFISTHAQVCMDFLSESLWTANLWLFLNLIQKWTLNDEAWSWVQSVELKPFLYRSGLSGRKHGTKVPTGLRFVHVIDALTSTILIFGVMIQTGDDRPAVCAVADRAAWARRACDAHHDDMPQKIIRRSVCVAARLAHHLHHLLPSPPPPVP